MNKSNGMWVERVRLLKKAKKKIQSGKSSFICFAIGGVGGECKLDVIKLKAEIRRRLYPYYFLETWLECDVGIKCEELTNKNMREYRLRWIDALIKEFS